MPDILAAYRAKYPQYKNVPDQQLGDAIYKKHYAGHMTQDEFWDKVDRPVASRVESASHQVMQDLRGYTRAPATPQETVMRSNPMVEAGKLGMDLLNVPLGVAGGLGEKAVRWAQEDIGEPQKIDVSPAMRTATQIVAPQAAGALDLWNSAAADPRKARRHIGTAAELAVPIPGVEAVQGARDILGAAKVAREYGVPMSVARAMMEQGVTRPFAEGATGAARKAARQISERVRLDTSGKGAPTAQEMLDHAKGLPRENMTLMDVADKRTTGLAGMVARSPEGAGGGTLRRFFRGTKQRPDLGRTNQLGPELEKETQLSLSSGSSKKTTETLRQHQQEESDILYGDAFEANPVIRSSKIDQMVRDKRLAPMWREAIADVRARIAGTDKPIPDKMSLRVLDRFKQLLYKASQKAPDTTLEAVYKRQFKALVNELDTLDRSPNKLYAQARKVFSDDSQSMDAVEFGRTALGGRGKSALTEEEIKEQFDKLDPGDQEMARLGIAEWLRNEIHGTNVGDNPAKKLALNESLKDRIRPFFKTPKEAEEFFNSATAKNTQFVTDREILAGSQTAERVGEDTAGNLRNIGRLARAGTHLSHGNVLGAGGHLAAAAADLAKRPKGDVGEQAANILTQRLSEDTTARRILEHRALQQAAAGLVKPKRFLDSNALRRGLWQGGALTAGTAAARQGQTGP